MFTSEDMLVHIQARICECKTQKDAAKELKISPQYLHDVLMRRREVSANLAAELGYDRIVRFVPKQEER